jgi:hypothetical protein
VGTRSRRLVKDYERLPETVAGPHFVAFAYLMLARAVLAFDPAPYRALVLGLGASPRWPID